MLEYVLVKDCMFFNEVLFSPLLNYECDWSLLDIYNSKQLSTKEIGMFEIILDCETMSLNFWQIHALNNLFFFVVLDWSFFPLKFQQNLLQSESISNKQIYYAGNAVENNTPNIFFTPASYGSMI